MRELTQKIKCGNLVEEFWGLQCFFQFIWIRVKLNVYTNDICMINQVTYRWKKNEKLMLNVTCPSWSPSIVNWKCLLIETENSFQIMSSNTGSLSSVVDNEPL